MQKVSKGVQKEASLPYSQIPSVWALCPGLKRIHVERKKMSHSWEQSVDTRI